MARSSGETAEQALATALTAATVASGSAPTITDLGLHLAAIEKVHDCFDGASLARNDKNDVALRSDMSLLSDRAEALRDLISTQPALSLSDAAIAVAEAGTIAARLSGDGAMPFGVVHAADKIERMLLAALPFIAAAAGLDMRAMDWDGNDSLRVHRYRAVGMQS